MLHRKKANSKVLMCCGKINKLSIILDAMHVYVKNYWLAASNVNKTYFSKTKTTCLKTETKTIHQSSNVTHAK